MTHRFQLLSSSLTLTLLSGMALGQSGLDLDRAYASQLREDAFARSSLLGQDNAPGLDIQVMTQIRYALSQRDEITPSSLGDSETTVGFSVPRAQVRISGAVTDTISGRVVFDFGGAENGGDQGAAELLVAQARWAINDDWALLAGQWHNPVMGSENFAPEHTLAADKSLTNEFFQLGYTQGVAFEHRSDTLRFFGAFSDGGDYITDLGSPANSAYDSAGESDFALSARVDWLVEGTWDQFEDAAAWRGSNNGIKLGAGAHWQMLGTTNPAAPVGTPAGYEDTGYALWTADARFEGDGWNAMAEYVGHHVDIQAATDIDYTNHGFIVQGGVFVSDQAEVFARYDAILLDDSITVPASDDTYQSFTAGVNYYFVPESHAARFTLDAVYSPDESTNLDLLYGGGGANDPDASGFLGLSDSEFMLRAQLTLLF